MRLHWFMLKHLAGSCSQQDALAVRATKDSEGEQPDPPPAYSRNFPWTVTHSFYAIMGGFAFDNLSNKTDFPLPQDRTRLTLTPEAVRFLAEFEPHMLPDISEDTIKDKSKSSGIAKVIAFWQALWFTAQFIMRLAQGLNVSMLELNTILHVVCAVVAYFVFWWKKPLDIMEPTLIALESRDAAIICAAMTVVSPVGQPIFRLPQDVLERAEKPITLGFHSPLSRNALTITVLFAPTHFPQDEIHLQIQVIKAALEGPPPEAVGEAEAERMNSAHAMIKMMSPPDLEPSELPRNILVRYPHGWASPSTRLCRVLRFTRHLLGLPGTSPSHHGETSVTLGAEDVRRYYLAAHGLSKYPSLMVGSAAFFDLVSPRAESIVASDWALVFNPDHLENRVSADPTDDPPDDGNKDWDTLIAKLYGRTAFRYPIVSILGFCVASLVYGGVHLLLGWNGPMNTEVEILLWRISGFALAAPWAAYIVAGLAMASVIWVFSASFGLFLGIAKRMGKDSIGTRMARFAEVFPGYFGILCIVTLVSIALCSLLLLLLSRVYVVVECFYSILFVPPSVYQVPVWAAYLPHF